MLFVLFAHHRGRACIFRLRFALAYVCWREQRVQQVVVRCVASLLLAVVDPCREDIRCVVAPVGRGGIQVVARQDRYLRLQLLLAHLDERVVHMRAVPLRRGFPELATDLGEVLLVVEVALGGVLLRDHVIVAVEDVLHPATCRCQ